MAITWQDVVNIAPALSTLEPAAQSQILGYVDLHIDDTIWLSRADEGRAYLAAHLGTLNKMQGRGPITGEHLGPAGVSFASMLQFGALGLTSYGLQYDYLIHLLPTALGAVY